MDLFSGIGGFSLGLERAGMRTVAFCENDAYCRRVVAKHWPGVPCYDDVRTLTAARLAADGISVEVICGGFPCQDISVAGRGAGIGGERSGLWSEFARLIGEIRPRYAIVENVAALLVRGIERVLGDMASLGYDAEWHGIPAAAVGAPHRRDRIWIVAYPERGAIRVEPGRRNGTRGTGSSELGYDGAPQFVACPDDQGQRQPCGPLGEERRRAGNGGAQCDVADTISARLEGCAGVTGHDAELQCAPAERSGALCDAGWLASARHGGIVWGVGQSDWWLVEPDVGRVAHGVPHRVDRLRALGNSLVPQIAELIGRAILAAEGMP